MRRTKIEALRQAHVTETKRSDALVQQMTRDMHEKTTRGISRKERKKIYKNKTQQLSPAAILPPTFKPCVHSWKKVRNVFGAFKRCTACGQYKLRKALHNEDSIKLEKLPAILKGKRLPWERDDVLEETNHNGVDIILVDDFIRIRRSYVFVDEWSLLVRFPKGWVSTAGFNTFVYDRVIRTLEKTMERTDKPSKLYEALMQSIYGHKARYRYERSL